MTTLNAAPSRRALQLVLGFFGIFGVATGVLGIVTGTALLSGGQPIPPDVDSNYRFFATFWLGVGLVLLWTAPRVERATAAFRAVGALVVLGGLARLLSLLTVGTPAPLFVGLTVLELVAPPILIYWQSRLVVATQQAVL